MKKKISFLLISIIILNLIFIYVNLSNKTQQDIVINVNLKIDNFDKKQLIEILIENVLNEISPQIIVGTLPAYSIGLIKRKLGIVSEINGPHWLNVDFSNFYQIYLSLSGQRPFGGFLLMDYNFARYHTESSQKLFLEKLRNKYAINIKVITLDKNFHIKIFPLLISDCIPQDDVMQPYCRILRVNDKAKKIDYEYIGKYYNRIGLNSPIGPIADVDNSLVYGINEKNKEAKKIIDDIITLKRNNQIPIVKHFGYSIKAKDTHKHLVYDNSTLKQINENVFYYYDSIEKINIPYMIMTGHHIFTNLDDLSVSRSEKISKLIEKRYPNAVVITDELSMMQKYTKIETVDLILSSKGSMKLIHSGLSGDIISKRNKIYQSIANVEKEKIKIDLKKILSMKYDYGIIEVVIEKK
jgi:hypothetical protein